MVKVDHTTQVIKSAIDVTSFGVVIGSVMELLPAVSAILAIVWTCIRIYETETIQKLIGKKK